MPTPSDRTASQGNHILEHFNDLRESMRQERVGSGGREVCHALTIALDEAIVELISPVPPGVAIVALGGYGRRELSPYSDVDLMVLHESEDASEVAANLFRPLWDARFRLGHSVRTLREAGAAAKERFETQTTLITARLVCGDAGLFDRLMNEVAAVTKARPLRRYLVAEERRRREAEPYLVMAADIKEGRGGLRTLQAFEWERRREGLIGRFSTEAVLEEEKAHEVLLAIRNGLHLAAGRAHDVFSTDLRPPVARWLGEDLYDTARNLVAANQTVDRLAISRWPEVIDDPPGPLGKRMWSRLRGRPDALQASRAPGIAEINWILETGGQGQIAFEGLWSAGLLDRMLPEWEAVRCEPQLAPFHEHPVDEHLWRTVDEMRQLTVDGGIYQEVADDLESPEVLSLCAFLHDIGKGHGGDHARVGAGIAVKFCSRLGLDDETSALIAGSVRHHLLLSEAATRRDLDDPAVIDEIATKIGDHRLLQVVYLLTVADSRATGPSMWGEWKASLLGTLYERCLASFSPAADVPATTRDQVLARVSDEDVAAHRSHIDDMPDDYLRSLSIDDVIWHVDVISGLRGRSQIGVSSNGPVETAVVVGPSTADFRQNVAAVFAANGIDVLEARMFTRADGLIVDTFQVRDDRTGDVVRSERWDGARTDLESAVAGDLDPFSKLEERAAAYPVPDETHRPSARCTVDPATEEVVVAVRCTDRIGRLAEILRIMTRAGLDIRLAKLDSRAGQLVDTFHVRTEKVVSRKSLDDLGSLIATSIRP